MQIAGNVCVVIVVQKGSAEDGAVKRNRCQSKQKAQNQSPRFVRLKERRLKKRRLGMGFGGVQLGLGFRRIHRFS
jgi:hypothetical protein